MKNTLYSKAFDCLEVEYEYTACPGNYDTPGYVRIDILTIKAMDSSINLYDWVSEGVFNRVEEEIQEQENENQWEGKRWAA
jgi:hypothetical protein